MSVFVAFEGGEGSGKSTQSKLLYERIIAEGFSSLLLHEPGGTSVGEEVRSVRENVGLLDLTSFTKHEISGPGAENY